MKLNYAAVVVSAVVYWLIGGLWYAVLFSKQYVALEHLTDEQMKAANPILPYIITFALNLLIAFVLAKFCLWRNADTAAKGAWLGILLWIGFIGPITYTTYMYELRAVELFAINQCYALVGLCVMGLILGGWTKKTAS
ncbi:MAG TPA: DUF1761 domain-containing protein [Candidatus Acidoferrum sp.]|nr:DUF1761 domain-containing protein [Candidatus Acidoferrum sp.]